MTYSAWKAQALKARADDEDHVLGSLLDAAWNRAIDAVLASGAALDPDGAEKIRALKVPE